MRMTLGLFLALLLAAPAAAQPNRLETVQAVAAADPARFACAHTDRPCAYDYITALVCELRKTDQRWGMNGRRGDPARPSWDAINYCGTGPATDPTGQCAERLTIVDVIVGAGGPDPRPTWQAFTGDATPGAWLVPACGNNGGGGGGGGGTGTSPVDLSGVMAALTAIAHELEAHRARLDALPALLEGEREKIEAVVKDVGAKVDAIEPPAYRGRILGQSFTLTPVRAEAAVIIQPEAAAVDADPERTAAILAIVEAVVRLLLAGRGGQP